MKFKLKEGSILLEKDPKKDIRVYVLHKHKADKAGLHYDFRYERNGKLYSWALPKGMPPIGEKRLAIYTEPHSMEWKNFEGKIPKGEYGAGEVEIYDKGNLEIIEEKPSEKITFILNGRRYEGKYSLVRLDKEKWLMIKSSK